MQCTEYRFFLYERINAASSENVVISLTSNHVSASERLIEVPSISQRSLVTVSKSVTDGRGYAKAGLEQIQTSLA